MAPSSLKLCHSKCRLEWLEQRQVIHGLQISESSGGARKDPTNDFSQKKEEKNTINNNWISSKAVKKKLGNIKSSRKIIRQKYFRNT